MSMARVLAEHGAKLAIQDLDLAVAQDLAREIGAGAIALGGDITDLSTPEMLVRETREKLGDPLILINNAAVQEHVDWREAKVERMEWQWRGNVLAPFLLMRLCIPLMQKARWGRIINQSSIQARGGVASMIGYSTTKAALENLTKAFARDFAGENITINAIAPGYFITHRNREQFQKPQDKFESAKWVPMKRAGDPEDVAGTTLLLCSEAGAYITGQVIGVDGGLSAR